MTDNEISKEITNESLFVEKTFLKFFIEKKKDDGTIVFMCKDFEFKEGLNRDFRPFDPEPVCGPGGFYYTDIDNYRVFENQSYGNIIGAIRIPTGLPIVPVEGNKFKSPEIYIEKFYSFEDFLRNDDILTDLKRQMKKPDIRMSLYQTHNNILDYISKQDLTEQMQRSYPDLYYVLFNEKTVIDIWYNTICPNIQYSNVYVNESVKKEREYIQKYSTDHHRDLVKLDECCDIFVEMMLSAINEWCVPHQLQTSKNVQIFLKKNYFNMKYIKSDLITEKMCLEAFDKRVDISWHIPKSVQTYWIAARMVKMKWTNLSLIEPRFRTSKMCLRLLQKKYPIAKWIPPSVQTQEIANQAFNNDFRNIKYIRNDLLTYNMFSRCVLVYYFEGIKYFDTKSASFLTEENILAAISSGCKYVDYYFEFLKSLDKHLQTKNIVLKILDKATVTELKKRSNIFFIREDLCDHTVALKIIEKRYYKEKFSFAEKDEPFCFEKIRAIIKTYPFIIVDYVECNKLNMSNNEKARYDLFEIALNSRYHKNGWYYSGPAGCVSHINRLFENEELKNKLYEKAVYASSSSLQQMPRKFITKEMAKRALKENCDLDLLLSINPKMFDREFFRDIFTLETAVDCSCKRKTKIKNILFSSVKKHIYPAVYEHIRKQIY